MLIGLGGWNGGSLKHCEKYSIRRDKWADLPPLNEARFGSGSVVLRSMQAFCFCGSERVFKDTNRIEKMKIEEEGEWRSLPLDQAIRETSSLSAVQFHGHVLVFGGSHFS